jgi:hypothetical protein
MGIPGKKKVHKCDRIFSMTSQMLSYKIPTSANICIGVNFLISKIISGNKKNENFHSSEI